MFVVGSWKKGGFLVLCMWVGLEVMQGSPSSDQSGRPYHVLPCLQFDEASILTTKAKPRHTSNRHAWAATALRSRGAAEPGTVCSLWGTFSSNGDRPGSRGNFSQPWRGFLEIPFDQLLRAADGSNF